jgi:hypothetical protein
MSRGVHFCYLLPTKRICKKEIQKDITIAKKDMQKGDSKGYHDCKKGYAKRRCLTAQKEMPNKTLPPVNSAYPHGGLFGTRRDIAARSGRGVTLGRDRQLLDRY